MNDIEDISACDTAKSSCGGEGNCSLCLPEPPERPLDSDCCGGGCDPCVMDIYREEVILWEAECERLKNGISSDKNSLYGPEDFQDFTLDATKYTAFPVVALTQETVDILRIRCGLARDQSLGLSMGQHIIVRFQSEASSITRQYTPVSPIDTKGYFELLIKIYPGGRMSKHIKSLTVGDKLQARGPAGHLAYKRNKYRKILMVCAGTGVAPMCQVISSILGDELDETYLRLVYACRSYSQLMAKTEIDEWKKFWNFSCLYVLSQEPEVPLYSYKYDDQVHKGRLHKDKLRQELGDNKESVLVLICGTRSFEADMLSYLKELDVPENNTHNF